VLHYMPPVRNKLNVTKQKHIDVYFRRLIVK